LSCILVVDDDALVRTTVRAVLEAEGYTVIEADDGARVRHILQERQVDLLLTDILMPDSDGVETITDIRRGDSNLKIIAMSGSGASSMYLRAALQLGADAILNKPFRGRELRELVARVIATPRALNAD
jgi:DNA-binding response OmpR family regulator